MVNASINNIYLQPYVNFRCVVKKIGTLIYPRNCDPLRCLSFALHDLDDTQPPPPPPLPKPSQESTLREAANILNDIVHNEIRKLKECDIDLTSFSLNGSVERTDRLLWDFINPRRLGLQ